jgi:hypothetical protein
MNIEPVNDPKVALALKRFLLIKQCPEPWKSLDLYVFRDEEMVFHPMPGCDAAGVSTS